MIVVQSTFQLLPESKNEALELMRNMVRLCRQEHGCLAYEYFEGLTDTNQVVLLQEWEDADCLQEHYQTDHMADFLDKLGLPRKPGQYSQLYLTGRCRPRCAQQRRPGLSGTDNPLAGLSNSSLAFRTTYCSASQAFIWSVNCRDRALGMGKVRWYWEIFQPEAVRISTPVPRLVP